MYKEEKALPKLMTLNQFAEKHPFKSVPGLRRLINVNPGFKESCIKKIGKSILINEAKALEYLDQMTF